MSCLADKVVAASLYCGNATAEYNVLMDPTNTIVWQPNAAKIHSSVWNKTLAYQRVGDVMENLTAWALKTKNLAVKNVFDLQIYGDNLYLIFLECASDEFKCAIGGGCIKNNQTCDGVDHCADKSDEWNCVRLEKEISNKKYLEVNNNL